VREEDGGQEAGVKITVAFEGTDVCKRRAEKSWQPFLLWLKPACHCHTIFLQHYSIIFLADDVFGIEVYPMTTSEVAGEVQASSLNLRALPTESQATTRLRIRRAGRPWSPCKTRMHDSCKARWNIM